MRPWFKVTRAETGGALVLDAADVRHVADGVTVRAVGERCETTVVRTCYDEYPVREHAEDVLRLMREAELRVEREEAAVFAATASPSASEVAAAVAAEVVRLSNRSIGTSR